MPPRKNSSADNVEPPRRSTRISALPKEEVKEKVVKTAGSKKRAAGEETEKDESSTSKKVDTLISTTPFRRLNPFFTLRLNQAKKTKKRRTRRAMMQQQTKSWR